MLLIARKPWHLSKAPLLAAAITEGVLGDLNQAMATSAGMKILFQRDTSNIDGVSDRFILRYCRLNWMKTLGVTI